MKPTHLVEYSLVAIGVLSHKIRSSNIKTRKKEKKIRIARKQLKK
jgi:hypothetical protein